MAKKLQLMGEVSFALTDEDRAKVVEEVIAALPVYSGEVETDE